MEEFRISEIIGGKTHIYESKLTPEDDHVSPRCKPTEFVRKSNTKSVSGSQLDDYIDDDLVCTYCLQYSGDMIVPEDRKI